MCVCVGRRGRVRLALSRSGQAWGARDVPALLCGSSRACFIGGELVIAEAAASRGLKYIPLECW